MPTSAAPKLHLVHPARPAKRPESPRERLLERGSGALTDAELVAVLLERCSLRGARELLERAGGISRLASLETLASAAAPEAGQARLAAALELARRVVRTEVPTGEPLSRPAKTAAYLHLRYCLADQEVLGALYLDVRHRLIVEREIFRGSLHRASDEPRQILREALQVHAAGVVLFHAHPSGDPTPSREDVAFTRRVQQAGEVVGVDLVDHIVFGRGGEWVSLKARGGW